MKIYNKGFVAQAETIIRCDYCGEDLEHTSCTGCGKLLLKVKAFRCFGSKGENWHECESCYQKNIDLKCKCGSDDITYWGVDVDEIYKKIIYECLICNKKWESEPIKKW